MIDILDVYHKGQKEWKLKKQGDNGVCYYTKDGEYVYINLETLLCDFDNRYKFKEVVFADKEVEIEFEKWMKNNSREGYPNSYYEDFGKTVGNSYEDDFYVRIEPTPQMLYKYKIDFLWELIKGDK